MWKKIRWILSAGSAHLSICMTPLIPIITAGSLVKLCWLLLDIGGLLHGSTRTIMAAIGDAPFYFLPILASVTAAEHFRADRFYAMGTACMLMMPEFIEVFEKMERVTFFFHTCDVGKLCL